MRMKRLLSSLFLILALNIAHSVEKTPQKVGITLPSDDAFSNMNVLIRKALLTELTNTEKIYAFEDNEEILLAMGVTTLNAKVTLQTAISGDLYRFEITDGTDSVGDSFELATTNFPEQIGEVVEYLASEIVEYHPPVDKKVLKEIKVETRKISIFETDKPTWRVGLSGFYQNRVFKTRSSSTNYGHESSSAVSRNDFGFYLNGHLQYVNANFYSSLLVAPGHSSTTMVFDIGAGIGILKSLFVVGGNFMIGYTSTPFDNNVSIEYPLSDTNTSTMPAPDVTTFAAGLSQFYQFNMTPQLYLQLKIGWFLIGNRVNLDFPDDSSFSDMSFPLLRSDGMDFALISLNYAINDRFRLVINYMLLNIKYGMHNFEDDNDKVPTEITDQVNVDGLDLFIDEIRISDTYIGLGIEYVF